MKTKAKCQFAELPKDYAGLCGILLPRPIRDAVDYSNVSELTDAMVLWQDDFSRDQGDYFELLCSMLEEYDAANVKWPKVGGVGILKHLLAGNDLTAADLARILGGSRNLGNMILRGERNLTLPYIRKLANYFRVGAGAFI